jgi:hypothetical protein
MGVRPLTLHSIHMLRMPVSRLLGLLVVALACRGESTGERPATGANPESATAEERAKAIAALLRESSESDERRVYLSQRRAWYQEERASRTPPPDSARLADDVYAALLAQPEVVAPCEPSAAAADEGGACEPPSVGAAPRYVLRIAERSPAPDTLEVELVFSQVRIRGDSSRTGRGFAYGRRVVLVKRDGGWQTVSTNESFIT